MGKINVSYPATGCQKLFEIHDEHKVRPFYEKRMGQEVGADSLGDEWKGYVFRITGGNDKQGFPMKKGHSCYRQRRAGERKRKSVRGCIVNQNLSVLSVAIVKTGETEIPGLTTDPVPRRLGPKRASHLRKLFNLGKQDDVRQYVIKRPLPVKEGKEVKKPTAKAPKIQRLVTPTMLQRKRHRLALKRRQWEKNRQSTAEYAKILAQRQKEAKEAKELRRKRSASHRESRASKSAA